MNQNSNKMNNVSYFVLSLLSVFITQVIGLMASLNNKNTKFFNKLAFLIMIIQWISFLHAGGIFGNEKTEKFYDLIGSLTFILSLLISIFSCKVFDFRRIIVFIFPLLWSLRLGSFLFSRILKNKVDSRFAEIKENNFLFLSWTLQGVWVFITLLSVLMLHRSSREAKLGILDYFGVFLWIFGFSIEVVADFQKMNFRNNPLNKEKFISEGLWAYSRHPNYFGEMILWFGISFICFNGMNGNIQRVMNFISPFFVSSLIIFISGIPKLEISGNERFGNLESYRKYKEITPVLIPFIGRRGDAAF